MTEARFRLGQVRLSSYIICLYVKMFIMFMYTYIYIYICIHYIGMFYMAFASKINIIFDISTSNNIGISNIYAKNSRKQVLDLRKIFTT